MVSSLKLFLQDKETSRKRSLEGLLDVEKNLFLAEDRFCTEAFKKFLTMLRVLGM